MWVSQGEVTDPADGEILADTGQLSLGINAAAVLITSTTSCVVELVRRNAANTADVRAQAIYLASYIPFSLSGLPIGLSMGERVILRVKGSGVVGAVQGSIFS